MPPAKQRGEYPDNWSALSFSIKSAAGWRCVRCEHANVPSEGYALTVHHFDGDRSNNEPWNLMALCQRCHLRIQAKVDPEIPLMFEPADWAKPYIAGFYEAGRGIPSPLYDLEEWMRTYPRTWPSWAPTESSDEPTE